MSHTHKTPGAKKGIHVEVPAAVRSVVNRAIREAQDFELTMSDGKGGEREALKGHLTVAVLLAFAGMGEAARRDLLRSGLDSYSRLLGGQDEPVVTGGKHTGEPGRPKRTRRA